MALETPIEPLTQIRHQLQQPAIRSAFVAWFEAKYPTRSAQAEKFADAPTMGLWQAFMSSDASKDVAVEAPVVIVPAAPEIVLTPQHIPAIVHPTNGHKPTQQALFDILAQGLQEVGFKPQADLDQAAIGRIALDAAKHVLEEAIASKRLTSTLAITINDKPPVVLEDQTPAWFPRALKIAAARKNVLLIGPAGSGKSYGAHLIAKALGLPYTPISLSGGTDEGILIGWLLPVGESGRFEYVESAFVHAYEHGGVVLLDELDAADANMLLVVNEALANGHLPLPLRRDKPLATRHPDFVALAAANTHGHGADRVYVGRNQLDGATLSRFRMGQINVDYDADLEKRLYAAPVVHYGQRLRERCRSMKGWTRDVSTRDIATVHDLVTAGVLTLPEAWYQFFADWSPTDLQKIDVMLNHTAGEAILR